MLGLLILFLFYAIGEALHTYLHIPLPGNVLGMILLFLGLCSGIKLAWVEKAADLLVRHMMLFFVPVIVGVMPLFPVLAANWLPISGGLVLGTLATMTAAAWTAQLLTRKEPAHG